MLVWYFLINGVKVRPLRCQFPFVQGDPAGLVLRTWGNTLKMLLCLYDSQMIEHDWTNHLESFIVSNFHDIQKVSPMIPFKLLALLKVGQSFEFQKSPCPHQLHRTYPSRKLIHHYHHHHHEYIYICYILYIYITFRIGSSYPSEIPKNESPQVLEFPRATSPCGNWWMLPNLEVLNLHQDAVHTTALELLP